MAKDLHLPHIEQLAAETGDVQLVKDIFNDVLNKLTGVVEKEVSITEKVDGVPLLFGKIGNEFFVGLKNRCFKNGKFVRSSAFFLPSDFSSAGGNAGLIENMYNVLKPLVSENTLYFGELLFSTHEKQEDDYRQNKNQTLVKLSDGEYLTQPNLLWYKIKGLRGTESLGVLQIGTFKNVYSDTDVVESNVTYGKFDFSSNSKLFLTTGELNLVLDSNDKRLEEIKNLVSNFNFTKTPRFTIKEYVSTQYSTGQYKDVSKAKELLLELVSEVRTVLGYKTVTKTGGGVSVSLKNSDKVDEGVVVSTSDYKVKFVSKSFFDYSVVGYYNKSKKVTLSNESVTQDKVTIKLQPNNLQPVVFFMGKFQPFHRGHHSVFKQLQTIWGNENVYVVTSNENKVGGKTLPANFKDKKEIISLYDNGEIAQKYLLQISGAPYSPKAALQLLKEKTPVTETDYGTFVTVVWGIGGKEGGDRLKGNVLEVSGPTDLLEKISKQTSSPNGTKVNSNTAFWTEVSTVKLGGVPLSATTIRQLANKPTFEVTDYKSFFPQEVYEKLESNPKAQETLKKIVGHSKEVQSSSYTTLLRGLVQWS